ncbi:hypothetical protein BBF96_04570 [Anoxybacter fermentans]|uniref:Uncharacterized protein n=1 Tax=Anoxybacter fermentans TaxID=1323375 RepID=A0A3S9SWL4_9FIRM|nr:hypothetical protein BBF96_04570 [Anoxybacter fermentans]
MNLKLKQQNLFEEKTEYVFILIVGKPSNMRRGSIKNLESDAEAFLTLFREDIWPDQNIIHNELNIYLKKPEGD